ncbi:hypothetical protein B0H13DRAFT_1861790 [Mycena leptocephala]|nr:hypothetical protein B0H13DRAFT_1861790 [Mycena leptocephala]
MLTGNPTTGISQARAFSLDASPERDRSSRMADVVHSAKSRRSRDKLRLVRYLQSDSHSQVERSAFSVAHMSAMEDTKVQGVLRTPTMARVFSAFNTDLPLLTHTVWMDNRVAVVAKYKYMTNAVLPKGIVGGGRDKVRSYCQRLIKSIGLDARVLAKHKDKIPDVKETDDKKPYPNAPIQDAFSRSEAWRS